MRLSSDMKSMRRGITSILGDEGTYEVLPFGENLIGWVRFLLIIKAFHFFKTLSSFFTPTPNRLKGLYLQPLKGLI